MIKNMMDQPSMGHGDGELTFRGEGGDGGYNLGILIFPGARLSFGLAFNLLIAILSKSPVIWFIKLVKRRFYTLLLLHV
ncbi:MAG: hypothetical protein ACMUIP_14030 [bacterium]